MSFTPGSLGVTLETLTGQSRDTDPSVLGNPGDAYGTTTRTLMAIPLISPRTVTPEIFSTET